MSGKELATMLDFNRIIIFTIAPINEDYVKRYGVDFFKKKGIEVVFLNLCLLIYGREKAKQCGWDSLGACKRVTEIGVEDYKELAQRLYSLKNGSIVYLNITMPAKLLFLIWKIGIPYIEGSLWGGIQAKNFTMGSKSFLGKFRTKLLKLYKSPLKILKGKLDSSLYKFIKLMHPPFLFLTNNHVELMRRKSRNILLNHTFDYDRFLLNFRVPKPEYIPNEKYLLLLPNHAWMVGDNIINDWQDDCSITKEQYKKLINATLNKIESATKMKILVAGYPNATTEEDIYEDRKFLLGTDTEQLVKYSSGVITHFTGAINFAVLHSKPICIINYRNFDNDPNFTNFIKSYSAFLNLPINYVDSESEIQMLISKGLFTQNFNCYAEYEHQFIIPNEIAHRGEKCFWTRVLDNINESKKL